MSITRISKNKYKIVIELGYDILGNRKRKTETFLGTKSEEIKREAELRSEFYHVGEKTSINDLTFEQYSEIFIEKYCNANLGMITTDGYKKSLRRINPLIGKIKLNKITSLILDSMYQKLKVGTKVAQVGYHSMYNYYKVINLMFNQAIRWELLDKNPNLKAQKPKREKSERKFYDLEQVEKLIRALDHESIKYKTLIILALDSGARRGEICALRWSDIDFENRTMKITKSLKALYGVIDEERAKTESSVREIMLSESTINLLKEYKEWQDYYIRFYKGKWINSDRVFTSQNGDYMYPGTCDQIIRKIVKKYNLDHICFHELRHTSASILINKGVNPKAVSQRLGHSDTSITMEIYTHVFDTSKKDSADKIDEVLKGIKI